MSRDVELGTPTLPLNSCQRCGAAHDLESQARAVSCLVALAGWEREPSLCGSCRVALANIVQEFLGEAGRCSY